MTRVIRTQATSRAPVTRRQTALQRIVGRHLGHVADRTRVVMDRLDPLGWEGHGYP